MNLNYNMEETNVDFGSKDDNLDHKELSRLNAENARIEDILDNLAALYDKVQVEETGNDVVVIEELKEAEIKKIEALCGKKLWGFKKLVKFNDARHIYKMHGQAFERRMKQRQIETADFIEIVDVLTNYTELAYQPYSSEKNKAEALIYYRGKEYEVVMKINFRNKELALKTMWINK